MPPLKPRARRSPHQVSPPPSPFAGRLGTSQEAAPLTGVASTCGEALDASAALHVHADGLGKTTTTATRRAPARSPRGARPEFPEGADLPPTGVARREFMQLLGASLALAAPPPATRPGRRSSPTSAASRDDAGQPPALRLGLLPGATAPALLDSHAGRPIKVEGNPQHPVNLGAAGIFEQAFLLSLYDPQRARELRHRRDPRSPAHLRRGLARHRPSGLRRTGARVRFLTEPNSSPVLGDLRSRIQQRLPNARFLPTPPSPRTPPARAPRRCSAARSTRGYDFSKADVVLSLDADFLESRPANLAYRARLRPAP